MGALVTAALAEAAGEPLQGALEADGAAQSGDGAPQQMLRGAIAAKQHLALDVSTGAYRLLTLLVSACSYLLHFARLQT